MKYDNVEADLFEQEAMGWIKQEKLISGISDKSVESINFNVIDTYRRLIRFPEHCPSCTRNGNDHDGECETPNWQSKDYGIFKDK